MLVLPFAAFALYQMLRGDLRVTHLLLLGIASAMAGFGPRSRQLLGALFPFGLVGLLYDGMRPYQRLGLTEERVLLCDLREVEARFFGVTRGGVHFTSHDLFQSRVVPALDYLCAFPYATFILFTVCAAIFLYFRDKPAMRRLGYGFLVLNVCGFVLYHLVPAAPPWYFHAHGCTVDLATRAYEGPNLARVDEALGVPWFHGMYGQASSVFGAMPSLHCAYPVLIVIEGWRTFRTPWKAAAIGYAALMVFAAVYLDHHWVLDAVAGIALALLVALALRNVEAHVTSAVTSRSKRAEAI